MSFLKRNSNCTQLSIENVGQEVVLNGWVSRRRDHGGLIFVDLRDRSGIIQVVFSPETDMEAFKLAETVRTEYVLGVKGTVTKRPEGTRNPNMVTGEIEFYASQLEVLNTSKTTPFYINDEVEVDELLRLKYRYLDLRRPAMQKTLILRHTVTKLMRNFLDNQGFLEIETPMLTKSTPEGARDYLVPSRVNPGNFFALPQSPQIFKQMLMVAGMEKYFQIVRCFRDEDLRADRQPEFTQLDIEMSFIEQNDILVLMEEMVVNIFEKSLEISIPRPFTRITYDEAMSKYGSDKPDLRFGMELIDVTEIVSTSDFKVFSSVAASGGQIKAINAKGCATMPRREVDELANYVAVYGAKGLAYAYVTDEGIKSPIAKFFSEEKLQELLLALNAQPGDILFFVADKASVVADSLGHLRLHIAERLNLIPKDVFSFVWVLDFPLFEYDEEEHRYVAIHHMFTSPKDEDMSLLETDPLAVHAKAYDLALNGIELGGGSIRIHKRDVQEKIFSLLGMSKEEAQEKFGFMLEAFEFGTPPHGGIAFGVDRILMLMAGKDTIRDCIAFPKTQSASCHMTDAPSEVSTRQLKELHIKLDVLPKSKQ